MRKLLAAVAVLVCAGLVGGADDEKYKSKDGKYTVSFPADAKVTTKTQEAGGVSMKFAQVEQKDKAYIVMYMDLPEAVKDVPVKNLLDNAEKGSVKETKGKLLDSKDIEFGKKKYPGREFVVEKDGSKIRSRIIVVGIRVYVVVVGGPKDYATGKEGDSFLDSFELTK